MQESIRRARRLECSTKKDLEKKGVRIRKKRKGWCPNHAADTRTEQSSEHESVYVVMSEREETKHTHP